eukprot:TRINITY_DN1147_c0_g1_i1.p1 TRINITY_DN1147_c0_g1~~TRINITY_DN1147_c0_g1_i1.p1  ORF type:complete len:736 (-),score=190.12 TRINITY_DN1147_c0_g1_i1:132-2339(-)
MPFVKQGTSTNLLQDAKDGVVGLGIHMQGAAPPEKAMPRADVCMVFPFKCDARIRWGDASQEEGARGLRAPTEQERHKMETWATKRNGTIMALSDAGLILMLFYSRDRDEIFVRVAADEQHLRQVAEMKRHKLELKPQYLSAFAEYKNDYAGRRENNYADRNVVSHLYKPHVDETDADHGLRYPKPDAIFRVVDRIQIMDYIIRENGHNCAGVDIGQLLHDKDLLQYFPMHENAKLRDLDKNWFRAFAWGTKIDLVRDYFGERIALYFLFISHMLKWLMLPGIVGFGLWFVDMVDGTPDNYTSLPLCVGMGIWCVLFVHFWRRTAAKHCIKWGTLGGAGPQLEPTRPEFRGKSRINPVTGRPDRYYPWRERLGTVLFSYAVLSVTIVVLLFFILCLFGLRHVFHKDGGRTTFQIINALAVEVLNSVFTRLAKWLTDRENHRSYSEYSNHLMAKTVVFKFINCYSSLYYIAFFKAHSHLFGMPMDCVNDDCMNDLGSQLAIFMIMRLTLQNFVELGFPAMATWWANFQEGRTFHTSMFTNPLTVMPDLSFAEKQSKKEDYDLYEDIDEILILYGYTTLFVVACPWVPLLAVVSIVLEVFLDQKKLVMLYRRPMPMPAANNEPFDTAFDVFGILAMLTNVAVIVFASHAFDHWTHAHKIALFLAVEHGLVAMRVGMNVFFPEMPYDVRLLLMQQQVVIHKHMDLGGEEDDHDTRASAMRTTLAQAPYIHDQDEEEYF